MVTPSYVLLSGKTHRVFERINVAMNFSGKVDRIEGKLETSLCQHQGTRYVDALGKLVSI
jgi:hypothetical protein